MLVRGHEPDSITRGDRISEAYRRSVIADSASAAAIWDFGQGLPDPSCPVALPDLANKRFTSPLAPRDYVRRLRTEKGRSQEDHADGAGIARICVGETERGKETRRSPSPGSWLNLAGFRQDGCSQELPPAIVCQFIVSSVGSLRMGLTRFGLHHAVAALVTACFCSHGQTATPSNARIAYAADRAEIEDLESRYLFALDWQDAPAYAATFTEDGVLDWAQGVVRGRAAIAEEVRKMRAYFARHEAVDAPTRPSRLRHFITNAVITVNGDRATQRAYWFEIGNDNRNRWPAVGGYGHYEDELRRVNGRWLFSSRKIYNEVMGDRTGPAANPVR